MVFIHSISSSSVIAEDMYFEGEEAEGLHNVLPYLISSMRYALAPLLPLQIGVNASECHCSKIWDRSINLWPSAMFESHNIDFEHLVVKVLVVIPSFISNLSFRSSANPSYACLRQSCHIIYTSRITFAHYHLTL